MFNLPDTGAAAADAEGIGVSGKVLDRIAVKGSKSRVVGRKGENFGEVLGAALSALRTAPSGRAQNKE